MRKPFTLVQMLVIVACLGLVAAVLFPVMARAREESRDTRFARFERVAQAVLAYSADNNDYAPYYYSRQGGNQYHATDTWVGRVFPYVGRREVFFDPTIAEPKADFRDADGDLYVDSYYGGASPKSPYTYRWQWITTIGLNAEGFATGNSGRCGTPNISPQPRKPMALDRPEMRLMLAPTQMDGRLGWMYFRNLLAMRPETKRRPGFSWWNLVWDARKRWNGRMIAAYADGHVGRFGAEKFVPDPPADIDEFCFYLQSKPGVTRFWGEPWSMY